MKCEHCGAPMRQGETACAYCGAVFETSQPMVVNIYNQEKQAEKAPEIVERVVYVDRPAPAVSRKHFPVGLPACASPGFARRGARRVSSIK